MARPGRQGSNDNGLHPDSVVMILLRKYFASPGVLFAESLNRPSPS
jgi:hypothetical protein